MLKGINIYVANLGAYTRGYHVGKWIELPCDNLDEELKEILEGKEAKASRSYPGEIDEEVAIHDYESEYTNIKDLNELVERLYKIPDYDFEIIQALIEQDGDIVRALDTYESGNFSSLSGVEDTEDLGYAAVENDLFGYEIPENLKNYIDYEAIGRDFECEGWQICTNSIAIKTW